MGKTNFIILALIAIIAAIFLINYLKPVQDTWGSNQDVVSQVEVREILLLEALNHNVTITRQEVNAAYLGLMNKSGLSNESYEDYITKEHGSRQAYDQNLEENMLVLKLINQQVNWSRIRVDNATVDAYIAQNSQIFPVEQLNDPMFKQQFYKLAKQQMFEKQRQQLINEYVRGVVQSNSAQ